METKTNKTLGVCFSGELFETIDTFCKDLGTDKSELTELLIQDDKEVYLTTIEKRDGKLFNKKIDGKNVRTWKNWSDSEIDRLFSILPNKKNTIKLAVEMNRTPLSIGQVWQWATQQKKTGDETGRSSNWAKRCREAKKRAGWVI